MPRGARADGDAPPRAGIFEPARIASAAVSAVRTTPTQRLPVGNRLGLGDAIVRLDASGSHANGLSLARKLAERLPQGVSHALARVLQFRIGGRHVSIVRPYDHPRAGSLVREDPPDVLGHGAVPDPGAAGPR